MNILSIGNSFSQDAQRYLHGIAKNDGFELDVFNLYIGGCPLSTHYRNMLSEQSAYTLEMNGVSTGFNVSLKQALLNRDWDVITLQQVSNKSPYYDTYQPYLDKLSEYVLTCVPKCKIAIHQTWAYEQDSDRLKQLGFSDYTDMLGCIKQSYQKAFDAVGADFIIPSGELFQKLIESGIKKIHRDTFHASYGIGRYALGLLWYVCLTGNNIENNGFRAFDEEISESDIKIIKNSVMQIIAGR